MLNLMIFGWRLQEPCLIMFVQQTHNSNWSHSMCTMWISSFCMVIVLGLYWPFWCRQMYLNVLFQDLYNWSCFFIPGKVSKLFSYSETNLPKHPTNRFWCICIKAFSRTAFRSHYRKPLLKVTNLGQLVSVCFLQFSYWVFLPSA